MQIFVLEEKTIVLNSEPSDTIENMEAKIQNKNIWIREEFLISKEPSLLVNDFTEIYLSDYNIQKQS